MTFDPHATPDDYVDPEAGDWPADLPLLGRRVGIPEPTGGSIAYDTTASPFGIPVKVDDRVPDDVVVITHDSSRSREEVLAEAFRTLAQAAHAAGYTGDRGITYGPRIVYGTTDKPTVAGAAQAAAYTAPSCFVCNRHPDAHDAECPVPYGRVQS